MTRSNYSHTQPRLYVPDALGEGLNVALSPGQSHYLSHVMRLGQGDAVRLFNGRHGEWQAALAPKKKLLEAKISNKINEQVVDQPLYLCCAPIKKAHFDFLVMKATELGVTHIKPFLTSRTNVREINVLHTVSVAIEAAEQSGRLSVPEISPPANLAKMAASWPQGCLPIVCAEWGEALPIQEALSLPAAQEAASAAVITGPEGGFAPGELEVLRALPGALPVRLGPRVLRADTAALAALTCWQALCGNWR